ncbi:MAG: glycosyltransferase family 4 protein [Chitinispirillaceae bacterium]|nr:glycosyltransferase family 4 protein [Chitinispirillaceae bacterium]
MNVGFVFNHSSIIGGGEISFLELVKTFRTGRDVTPVAIVPGSGEIQERLSASNVTTAIFGFPHVSFLSLVSFPKQTILLARLFNEHALDLVHVNGARSMLYAGPAARRASIPCVWHNRVLRRDPLLDRFRSRYAARVIANSQAVASALQKKGIVATVIYNGFDLDSIQKRMPLDIRREFQVAPETPVILAVGRLCPLKGYDDLLDSCAILSWKKIPYFCLIAGRSVPGNEHYVRTLLNRKEACGLADVHFAGWRDDVIPLMKSATVLAIPSHVESFGRTIIEAWACGLPVVSTDAGGPAEIIRHGENGMLVPPNDPKTLADALEEILSHPEKQAALRTAGLAKAQEFSLHRQCESIAALYRDILGK